MLSYADIMCDKENSHVFLLMKLAQEIQQLHFGQDIQSAGWLISQQQFGSAGQS